MFPFLFCPEREVHPCGVRERSAYSVDFILQCICCIWHSDNSCSYCSLWRFLWIRWVLSFKLDSNVTPWAAQLVIYIIPHIFVCIEAILRQKCFHLAFLQDFCYNDTHACVLKIKYWTSCHKEQVSHCWNIWDCWKKLQNLSTKGNLDIYVDICNYYFQHIHECCY